MERCTLVTGAASGIGRALAERFAADGDRLVLVDRSGDGLERAAAELCEAHGVGVDPLVVDLLADDAVDRIAGHVDREGLFVATLVNNAGVPVYGPFAETDIDDELAMLRLNAAVPTALCDRFLDPMRERGEGAILNVASLAGRYPVPNAAVYGGSKAYLRSFSLALATELADEGITVTALCPGETDTRFMERGGMASSGVADRPLARPEAVAAAGHRGLRRGDRLVVPGWRDRLRYHLGRLLPERIGTRLVGRYWRGE